MKTLNFVLIFICNITLAQKPESIVNQFISNLGNKKLYSAYSLTNVQKWKSYAWFSSNEAYGGITKTLIYSIKTINQTTNSAIVSAKYYSEDPHNKSGDYSHDFYLNNSSGSWKIIEIKNSSKTKIETSNVNNQISGKRFAFVVLTVEYKAKSYSNKQGGTYYYTSGIGEYSNWNEDLKYKLMDQTQSTLRNTFDIELEYVKTTDRECLVFTSYKSASIARAKYTVSNE